MDHDNEKDLEIEGMRNENDGKEERSRSGSGSEKLREPLLVKNNRMNTTSQLAIVGANVCPIESLDYEYCLNFFLSSLNSFFITIYG